MVIEKIDYYKDLFQIINVNHKIKLHFIEDD